MPHIFKVIGHEPSVFFSYITINTPLVLPSHMPSVLFNLNTASHISRDRLLPCVAIMRSRRSNEISFGNEKERDLWSSIQPAFTTVCLVGRPIIAAPWGGGG